MKKKKIFIIVGILTLVLILIGGTYALWKKTSSQSGTNTITSSCFKLNFIEDVNSTINIQKGYPLTDEQGLALTPYTFTLNNACGNNNVRYQLNLEIINTTTLDSGYVKVAFNDEVFILNTKETTDKTLSNAKTAYLFDSGYFAGGESKDYTLRIWLDGDITKEQTDTMGKRFEAKVTVTSEYVTEIPPAYPTASEKIIELAKTDTTNLASDEAGNNRYIGANPNNYVTFNGETAGWRIIGSFKDIDDGTGRTEWRTKIIKTVSLGNRAWDTDSANGGYGINEWSTSDIETYLNDTYYPGLTQGAKDMIGEAIWNLGTIGSASYTSATPSTYYGYERSNNTGKICSSGSYCNDTVTRTTKWTGKIGLMYPSDYGYATGGSTRSTCLNTALYNWDGNASCYNNDWIFNSANQWTMTPYAHSSYASYVFPVSSVGYVGYNNAYSTIGVRPVLYLSSNVQILGGSGTSADPYTLKV